MITNYIRHLLVLVGLSLLLLTACQTSGLSLQVDDLSLESGKEQTVEVTLERKGLNEPISLSASDVPEGLSITFPSSPTTANVAQMRLEASEGLSAGVYSITVQAKAASVNSSTSFKLTVTTADSSEPTDPTDPDPTDPKEETVTLKGRLTGLDEAYAEWQVLVSGATAVTVASDGSFSVENVSLPYDLSVWSATDVRYYQGLTKLEPVVNLDSFPLVTKIDARSRIEGTVLDCCIPDRKAVLTYVSDNAFPNTIKTVSSGAFSWEIALRELQAIGTLHALEWKENDEGMIERYTAYGKKEGVSLRIRETSSGHDLELAEIAMKEISGTYRLPEGTQTVQVRLEIVFDDGGTLNLENEFFEDVLPSSFSYVVPDIEGATFTISIVLNDELADLEGSPFVVNYELENIQADTRGLLITPPEAPQILSPTEAVALAVSTETLFSWTDFGNALYLVEIYPTDESLPYFHLYTEETSVTLPDLSAYGLSLPKSADYKWRIESFRDVTTEASLAEPRASLYEAEIRSASAGGSFITAR